MGDDKIKSQHDAARQVVLMHARPWRESRFFDEVVRKMK